MHRYSRSKQCQPNHARSRSQLGSWCDTLTDSELQNVGRVLPAVGSATAMAGGTRPTARYYKDGSWLQSAVIYHGDRSQQQIEH